MNAQPLDPSSPLFALLARELLADGRSIRFAARGASMSPFLRDGALLTFEPAHAGALRVGDIVLYSAANDRLVAHRLQFRAAPAGDTYLVVRGDNQIEDDRVEPEQVLGRAVRVQRGSCSYSPASWTNRIAALAATRCRRQWRILRARFVRRKPDHC